MASGFWYLEDGRCFARRMSWMAHLMELITNELKEIEGAGLFYEYLKKFVPDQDDESNGYGGFIRKRTGENIMMVLDLREFTPENRAYFWQATQQALQKLILKGNEQHQGDIVLLKLLLDMHKRIKKGESPEKLSDTGKHIEPYNGLKAGPGWN
jgi:hypothetical protein